MIQLGRFDELGSGVINIHKYLPAYSGGADPLFEDTREGFRLTLPLTLLTAKVPEISKTDSGAQTGQVAGQVTGQVAEWILHALEACATPQKSSDIQKIVGIKHRETFQRNYLDQLLESNLIERTIPEKPNSRLQKYRLTEKGKKLIRHG